MISCLDYIMSESRGMMTASVGFLRFQVSTPALVNKWQYLGLCTSKDFGLGISFLQNQISWGLFADLNEQKEI